MQQDQYIYVCIHLHYYHPTSHDTKIISPHTHTHTYNIRMYITYITNCLLHPVHISLTHYQSDTPVHAHTYIHTHKLTHHHPSITLILPLPLLLFYAQSKSGEVVNMWGYPVLSFFLSLFLSLFMFRSHPCPVSRLTMALRWGVLKLV